MTKGRTEGCSHQDFDVIFLKSYCILTPSQRTCRIIIRYKGEFVLPLCFPAIPLRFLDQSGIPFLSSDYVLTCGSDLIWKWISNNHLSNYSKNNIIGPLHG